jgi:hypothetical protein
VLVPYGIGVDGEERDVISADGICKKRVTIQDEIDAAVDVYMQLRLTDEDF